MTSDSRAQLAGERDAHAALDYERFVFAAIARSSSDAVICTDLEGMVTVWNASATQLFGYSPQEMIGTSFSRIVPADFRVREAARASEVTNNSTSEYEASRLGTSGAPILVLGCISPILDEAGMVIGALRLEHKISREVGEIHSRLAAIVESSNDAIVSKNLDGIVTSWNEAACRLFGHTADEMVGQPILKIIPEDLHSEEAEILRKIRSGERIEHYETRRVRKDGEIIEVSLTISPIRDSEGNIIGSSKIARGISERKRMERLLIQSEKLAATGRMAATIAHEINNPLDSVMNLVYLARTMLPSSSKALPYLFATEKELERVAHIARQTLGYYRDPGPPSQIHLGQLFEEVLSVYRSKLLAANVVVDCAFAHHGSIWASKEELMQVFSNLITNAVDAMPDGGVLNIETRASGSKGVEVLIRDKGVGISSQNLYRVFEPFFTTKPHHGTGIGLWVARQLLEKRGGSIHLQSNTEFPLNGTTVSVFFPFQT